METNICSSCGGKIEFSPQDKALKCVNCGNLYSIDYRQTIKKHPIDWVPDRDKLIAWGQQNRSYKCKTCGAQITFNKYDIAQNCQYCNTNSLVPLKDLPGLQPEIVIPFKINKEQAKTEFANRVKKRHFLPLDFKRNLPNTELSSTYISSFTFECFVDAKYSGRQRITRTERDSNGRSRSVTTYRYFSGTIKHQFDNLVVESSDKINQSEIKDILPYNFAESYDYEDDFIKGYNVGYYNQSVEDAKEVAKRDAYEQIERMIRAKYSSIDSLTIEPTYSNIQYNYALLPMYFINFVYKNKPYINNMNGQTGKTGGKVPRSGLQITLFTLFMILVIGFPLLCIILSML